MRAWFLSHLCSPLVLQLKQRRVRSTVDNSTHLNILDGVSEQDGELCCASCPLTNGSFLKEYYLFFEEPGHTFFQTYC